MCCYKLLRPSVLQWWLPICETVEAEEKYSSPATTDVSKSGTDEFVRKTG